MGKTAVRVFIEGRVQMVGFRYWMAREASLLGLDGWVRNLADGSVEAVFSGPEESVKAMVEGCWDGPPMAAVTAVSESRTSEAVEPGFRQIR